MDSTDRPERERCDFCRHPFPEARRTLERDGTTYEFCSETCRDAVQESDRVFTEYHGHRRVVPGVSALDDSLPQGMRRNSLVLVSGQAGSRDADFHAELVWRTLRRGESAVIVSFQEPPMSVVERFLALDWNVLPYLERGELRILDCFTYRVDARERMLDRMSAWNRHLHRATEPAVSSVRDPSDVSELQNKLDNLLDAQDMVDEGIVVVDSLTEFGALVQPVQAYDFVKDVRADVCKGRFVPVFAGATFSGHGDSFPHDLQYIVDGIVDLHLDDEIVDDTLIKRIRVRKMSGVLVYPEWTAYEYTSGRGMVTFVPEEEIAEAEASEPDERAATVDGVPEDGEESEGGEAESTSEVDDAAGETGDGAAGVAAESDQ